MSLYEFSGHIYEKHKGNPYPPPPFPKYRGAAPGTLDADLAHRDRPQRTFSHPQGPSCASIAPAVKKRGLSTAKDCPQKPVPSVTHFVG